MHIRHIFHSESDLAQRLSQRFLRRWKRMLTLYEEHRQRLSKGVALKCVSIAWAFCSAAMEGNAEVPCQIEDVLERHTQEWIEIDGEPFACEDAEIAEQLIWDTVCLMLEEDEPQPEWQYAFDIAGGHSAYAYKREVLEDALLPAPPKGRAPFGEVKTRASNDYQTTKSKGGTTIINNYFIIYNKEKMDIDIEKLAQAVASGINLDGFKGDLVAVKVVENEIGNIEPGGIGVQNVYEGASQAPQPPKEASPQPSPKGEGEQTFGFIIYSRHTQGEIDAQMESLSIKCQGSNSRSLMRLLNDLDKDGYIDISDVSAAELYAELVRVFGMPQIKKRTFAEAFRLIG